ncbi:MAG: amidohydrolase [Clostridia bacterium]|nr:amidohydrolase [Clostridia bacterium]
MESFVVNIRRQLHMYPEIGFDLERTLALLRSELDKMGVEYTEEYGKSSIVATINPDKTNFTIGIRADTDALPIQEQNDIPFKSKLDGQMHACGHDSHTAIALDACRRLNEMKDKINCRVKFLFQAAEEYPPSGAKLMAADGVMKDIDCIIGLHVDTDRKAGVIAIRKGARNATSDGFYLEFYGKTAHAASQQKGIDAIMMAVKAYTDIEFMIAKEIKAKDPIIFNVGAIHGGVANNIICDKCTMFCTLRTQKQENADYILGKIKKIIASIADVAGGEAKFVESKHYPIVINNDVVADKIIAAAEKVVGKDNIKHREQGMGGEDFAYFALEKPGCMFELGVRNEELGYTIGVHNEKFMLDEAALPIGSDIFVQFVLDNMNGFTV